MDYYIGKIPDEENPVELEGGCPCHATDENKWPCPSVINSDSIECGYYVEMILARQKQTFISGVAVLNPHRPSKKIDDISVGEDELHDWYEEGGHSYGR